MHMKRIFLPVGQGAFYLEQFQNDQRKINVIYDCGSSTDIGLVEGIIRSTFAEGEEIQALFISHLDDDHINGIPFLLNYCNVKRIFFPLLTEEEKIYMEIYMKIFNEIKSKDDSFAASFISNPFEAINKYSKKAKLFGISEKIVVDDNNNDNDDNNNDNYDENRFYRILDDRIAIYHSGTDLSEEIFRTVEPNYLNAPEWKYIPFNFKQKDRITQLKSALELEFGKPMDSRDLQYEWEKGSHQAIINIKSAYRKVKGTFNTNSMVLFSGSTNHNIRQYISKCSFCKAGCCHAGCCYTLKPSGCLYTGDYDASGKYKWYDLKVEYQSYWQYIGCVQLPHHGSYHNYNDNFADIDAFFVISAGSRNKYSHPHAKVLKHMFASGIRPLIISEKERTLTELIIQ